ncbi:MAG: energy transducer TonB [Flavobacterium sp.]|uniref:energy transducer TonB n=1 Tax=Flavobacterium sp. TaxID=239 RepID=UPI002735B085|nr:energy transducer TonB [Flavobacterium sp.]MDP3680369.1 energy transducer TonB [Flavobacterium sp.]
MKKLLVLFVLLSSITFYAQKKVYFTEDFKELPSADNAIYYTIYEESPEGTLRTTYYLDNSLFTKDHFSNYKRRILNGTSEKWYKNGTKQMLAIYIKGKQEGVQTRYFENGQVKRTENFKNGEFVDGKCFDENGTEIAFFPYYVKPEFPGGMKAFYDYVANNFKSPNSGRGEIRIGFYVELDGTLNHFEVVKSINKEMDLSAIRLLVNGPRWTPGKIDGKETRVKFGIPITVL